VLAVLFFAVLLGYIAMARDTRQTAQWKLTEARVVAHTRTEASRSGRRPIQGNCLRMHLQYPFRAQVMSSELELSDTCSVGAEREAELKTYAIGNKVRVLVNPNAPLEVRSLDYPQLSPIGLLAVMMALALALILIMMGIVLGNDAQQQDTR
jgi:hypothetical protein